MTKGFQISGNNINPYHLSIGAIVENNNKYALVKKADGIYTLPRETMYSKEGLEDALYRGLQEELGIKVTIIKYLGSLITHFPRLDGTDIEKATIYFLTQKTGETKDNKAEDELLDTIEWHSMKDCIKSLKKQNNSEFKLFERI